MQVLALVLLLGNGSFNTTHKAVDVIELNHMHDAKGAHIFSQVVFWEIVPSSHKRIVMAWTMCDTPDKRPTLAPDGRKHVRWQTDDGQWVDVHSDLFHESWTHQDVERENQKVWPLDQRTGLGFK